MRPLILSLCGCALALSAALAQSTGNGNTPQLPVGQTYRDFQFPLYQDGQLKATLAADEAKGITLNRAETTNLKIQLYENGKATTTITSPKADLYVADRKMRTKNTVLIERDDMIASAQTCDFDLLSKNYLLHENVKVILKNFDAKAKSPTGAAPLPPARAIVPIPTVDTSAPTSSRPAAARSSADTPLPSMSLDMPGAVASTNAPPDHPSNNVTP